MTFKNINVISFDIENIKNKSPNFIIWRFKKNKDNKITISKRDI